MPVRQAGTDYPAKRRSVPEQRSTQPHCLEDIKNQEVSQNADRLTLGFHDAHFLPHHTLLLSRFFYFILPLTLNFLCTFSPQSLPQLCLYGSTFFYTSNPPSAVCSHFYMKFRSFIPCLRTTRKIHDHIFTISIQKTVSFIHSSANSSVFRNHCCQPTVLFLPSPVQRSMTLDMRLAGVLFIPQPLHACIWRQLY